MTDYQKQVNKSAQDIAARDPTLLVKRGKLLEAAQNVVYDSGYCFKKGYSRSKRWSKGYEKEAVKRPKLNKEIRENGLVILMKN